jgi:hypothetical protein
MQMDDEDVGGIGTTVCHGDDDAKMAAAAASGGCAIFAIGVKQKDGKQRKQQQQQLLALFGNTKKGRCLCSGSDAVNGEDLDDDSVSKTVGKVAGRFCRMNNRSKKCTASD